MDTKEMNIAIYRAIANKANELFQRVKISAGTYSAKELSENKKDKKFLCWEMEDGKEGITISVESFVCRFVASMVFAVLARFEKLVPSKERIKFTRLDESETVCRLSIQVSKEAAKVAKFAAKGDELRETLRYVYFDAKKGVLVATNGKRLAVRPVSISNVEGEFPEKGFYISPKFLKDGRYEIACIRKAGELFTMATNAAGETSLCPSEWRYQDYRSVIPESGKAIRVLDVETFAAFVKQAAKDKNCKLCIEAKAGSGRISISAVERWDENNVLSKIEVELLHPATCTAVFGFEPSELLPALSGWTGELLIHERCTCARIGSSIGQTVVVYCDIDGWYSPQISEEIEEDCTKDFANSAAKLANFAKSLRGSSKIQGIAGKHQGGIKNSVGRKYFPVERIFRYAQVIQIYAQQKFDWFRMYPKRGYGITSEILYDRRRDVVRSPSRSRKVNFAIPGTRFFELPAENSPPVHALSARFYSSFIILNS